MYPVPPCIEDIGIEDHSWYVLLLYKKEQNLRQGGMLEILPEKQHQV